MSVFSSGSQHKSLAKSYLAQAQNLQDQQNDVEFQRNLLSNIRQERIARSQLELANTSSDYVTSSNAGAIAQIDSSLAGEMKYSYESSARAEKIQDLQESYKTEMKKYAKQQKTRATAFAVTGAALAAVATFGVGAALGAGAIGTAGAAIGSGATASTVGGGALAGGTAMLAEYGMSAAMIGQGIGQIASNTGEAQTQQGIENIMGGFANQYKMDKLSSLEKSMSAANTLYQTTSINPTTNQEIANSQRYYMYSPTAGKAVPLIGGIFS